MTKPNNSFCLINRPCRSASFRPPYSAPIRCPDAIDREAEAGGQAERAVEAGVTENCVCRESITTRT
jgi:hypothetical protein